MVSLLKELRDLGEPWCVWRPLTATQVLVAAKANSLLTAGIDGGPRALLRDRIVICGFAYNFRAADGNGFDLVARSQEYSPGGTTDITIYGDRATTAVTRVSESVPRTLIALDSGGSPARNPASLVLVATGTPPTSGHIVIWGVICPGSEPLLNNEYYGSPFAAGTAPPN